MMLYLDTSALVKLYVDEPLSRELSVAVSEAEAVATSLLAYAETITAFARARREARLSPHGYRHIVEDWSSYVTVEVTDRLVKSAGHLAASRALSGYDAWHLSSALSLHERVPSSVLFVAFDRELNIAAKRFAFIRSERKGRQAYS